jgi:hypothetical protein
VRLSGTSLRQPVAGNGFRTVALGPKIGFVESRINSSQRALRYFKAKATIESGRGVDISVLRSIPELIVRWSAFLSLNL